MLIGITTGHDHQHVHNARGHGESCTCRACRYDGSVNDLLRLRNAVDEITHGEDPGAQPKLGDAPVGSPARTLDRLADEYANYGYHRGVSVYA